MWIKVLFVSVLIEVSLVTACCICRRARTTFRQWKLINLNKRLFWETRVWFLGWGCLWCDYWWPYWFLALPSFFVLSTFKGLNKLAQSFFFRLNVVIFILDCSSFKHKCSFFRIVKHDLSCTLLNLKLLSGLLPIEYWYFGLQLL